MSKELTEKQRLFLEHLFGEAQGVAHVAKVMAGYSPQYSTSDLVKSVEDALLDYTKRFLVQHGPKAVISLVGVMDNPTELGVAHKITAAKDVLDRIGISKTEKVEVSNGLFILPPKDSVDG
jgi:hypothetical protein